MENFKVSMRYAKALFTVAKDEGKSKEVLSDLMAIVKLINTSSDFKLLIHSPVIALSKKQKIFEEIFKNKLSTTLTYKFIMLLVSKHREYCIKGICRCFDILFNEDNGRIACQIISVRELSQDAKKRVIAFIEQHTKLTAVPEYLLEADLIGGIKIKIDNWVYDATMQNRLKVLKHTLLQ